MMRRQLMPYFLYHVLGSFDNRLFIKIQVYIQRMHGNELIRLINSKTI